MLTFFLILAAVGTAGFVFDSLSSDDTPSEDETRPNDIEISGSMMDDLLVGSDEDESFFGLDGNDTISGLDGDDTLRGQGGSEDQLFGGAGDDLLIDGTIDSSGSRTLIAAGGQTALNLSFNDGGDLFGEEGDDTILVVDGDGLGGEGNDVLSNWDEALLGSIPETSSDGEFEQPIQAISPILATQGNNLHGGEGDDLITSAQGNAFGDAGNDTIFGNGVDLIEGARDEPRTSANFTLSGGTETII